MKSEIVYDQTEHIVLLLYLATVNHAVECRSTVGFRSVWAGVRHGLMHTHIEEASERQQVT
jgi:hypothetical protein